MGVQQPYMYDDNRRDSRLPEKPFEPKAITRASWEPKPRSPKKQDGPLIAFNRHPDAHVVPTPRTFNFRPMSNTTTSWIKWTRYIQIGLRLLEMMGGLILLTLMILISNVDPLTSWVMRITPGATAISCVYAVVHLSRHASSRPPASSAAYQLFAGLTDLAVLPLYAFGAISVANHGSEWTTLFQSSPVLTDYLVQAEQYTIFIACGFHLVSLCISVWLGLMFRRIAKMPPDMNPLESHLTSRANKHKRNKSSMASSYTAVSDTSKRLSTPLESYRHSGAPYEDLSRPPSIPFMHTRAGSRDSLASSSSSSKRDSRSDLPSRQYQITPGNNSPRNSTAPQPDPKRMSAPALAQRGSYTEIPLRETGSPSRPTSSSVIQPINASPTRVAKFTEAWYTSDSLINRTQQRQRALNAAERSQQKKQQQQQQQPRQYEALSQRYALDDASDSDSDRENAAIMGVDSDDDDYDDENALSSPIDVTGQLRPHPLRLHPVPTSPPPLTTTTPPSKKQNPPREKTPFRPRDSDAAAALSEVADVNARRTSGSRDITDAKAGAGAKKGAMRRLSGALVGGGGGWRRGNRNSSIQTEEHFSAKPYGDLKAATPPIMVGGSARQVSSGNDYDLGSGASGGGMYAGGVFGRRNVSGKVAEEGLAGARAGGYSRYSVLNE
ncbi:hypothetical protein F4779DRAFT_358616 [Xylariaceae sp. FL0662B]|nr:hypothetical protein F4779DRAFT_358616 [Xylariaceae sp. FL0662B]